MYHTADIIFDHPNIRHMFWYLHQSKIVYILFKCQCKDKENGLKKRVKRAVKAVVLLGVTVLSDEAWL